MKRLLSVLLLGCFCLTACSQRKYEKIEIATPSNAVQSTQEINIDSQTMESETQETTEAVVESPSDVVQPAYVHVNAAEVDYDIPSSMITNAQKYADGEDSEFVVWAETKEDEFAICFTEYTYKPTDRYLEWRGSDILKALGNMYAPDSLESVDLDDWREAMLSEDSPYGFWEGLGLSRSAKCYAQMGYEDSGMFVIRILSVDNKLALHEGADSFKVYMIEINPKGDPALQERPLSFLTKDEFNEIIVPLEVYWGINVPDWEIFDGSVAVG